MISARNGELFSTEDNNPDGVAYTFAGLFTVVLKMGCLPHDILMVIYQQLMISTTYAS